jgi:hypothetical protein
MTYLAVEPPEVTQGLEVTQRAYGLIAARAAARGARTGLVLLPARFQVDDAEYAQLAAAAKAGGHELSRNSGSDRFDKALSELELPLLDLLPTLAGQPHPSALFFQRNVHLTSRGHQVVADALSQFVLHDVRVQ